MKLRELGEDRLLAELLPLLPSNARVLAPAGDDCAVVKLPGFKNLQLLKTDCLVEGVHFAHDANPSAVGWKAIARPLSDFAAMSGVPQFALITLVVRPEVTLEWAKNLYRGMCKAAAAFDVAIVGGETSSTNGPIVISVGMTGFAEPKRWVSRAGGRAGDELFVTGRLGGSLAGRHLRFLPRLAESRWLTENFPVHAMIDLSDGLGADLPRLARANGLDFEVDESALPLSRGCNTAQAISDGEDYELLFAIPSMHARPLAARWRKKFPVLPLTRIGRLTRTSNSPRAGQNSKWRGYAHFK